MCLGHTAATVSRFHHTLTSPAPFNTRDAVSGDQLDVLRLEALPFSAGCFCRDDAKFGEPTPKPLMHV